VSIDGEGAEATVDGQRASTGFTMYDLQTGDAPRSAMHDGRIIEEGTHDELLAAGSRYAELFTVQAAAYR
jgi:hypothetical protein